MSIGFVFGTLLSALLNLPDILRSRYLFAITALAGALTNALFGIYAQGPKLAIALRFLTGMFLAGVYPPAMKIMATWFRRSRGMALGILVGALTLGKALPYLINGIGSANWRYNVLFVSLLAVGGGLIVLFFVSDGPYAMPAAKFDWQQAGRVFRNRGVRLASFGYFGHMWELYAMWTWIPAMIRASLSLRGSDPAWAEVGSFLVIGSGAAGCVVAGSGCRPRGSHHCHFMGHGNQRQLLFDYRIVFGAHPLLLLTVAAIWGASVVADSAQFSTCVTELGDPRYIGTALTIQTSLGFLLTTISIQLIPTLEKAVGWQFAFAALAPGPIFGILAMLRLRSLPEAAKIAHGRR